MVSTGSDTSTDNVDLQVKVAIVDAMAGFQSLDKLYWTKYFISLYTTIIPRYIVDQYLQRLGRAFLIHFFRKYEDTQ